MAARPMKKTMKRAGRFTASDGSTPTFAGEVPLGSFEEGAALFRQAANQPGQALLDTLDEIIDATHEMQKRLGGDFLDSNSAASFALRIQSAAGSVGWRVMNAGVDPPDAIMLANDVMNLARLFHAMSIEFGEGHSIGSWREMNDHQRQGGSATARRRRRESRVRHRAWQNDARALWADKPSRSANEVARILSKRYGPDSPFSASANTIRLALQKPDGEQSKPSAPGDT